MNKIRTLLCIILAAVTALGAGCTPRPTVSSSAETADETLSGYINFSWFAGQWGGDRVTKTLTERTGVDVEFIVPQGSEKEKLDALISQGNLPDMITLWWGEPQVQQLIDSGYVWALNELAEQYCPEFLETAGPEQLAWYTDDDGNIYCYPGSSVAPEDYETGLGISSNQTFLVRKDIYEALGSPDMTTPEGFCDAVRRAAELFPEVDGYPLIPIGLHEFTDTGCYSLGEYLMNYLAVPYEVDGKLYDRFSDPEYLRWLKVFRQLNEEGYLSRSVYLDRRSQMSEKIARGQYFCMLYQSSDMITQQRELWASDPDKIYIAVDGPKNQAGDDPVLASVGITGWTVTLITKECSDPSKAIRLMNYMVSEEGQKLTLLGVEGTDYVWENGKVVLTDETRELYLYDYPQYVATVGADNTYWMLQDTVMQSQWKRETDEAADPLLNWTTKYSRYVSQYNIAIGYDAPEFNLNTTIEHLWGETLPELLMAESDEEFDRIFAKFVEQREQLGFSQVMEEKNRLMMENVEKLGML